MSRSSRKARLRRRQRMQEANEAPRMSIDDAMDIIDDDLPDGAYWALLEEMTGCEPADVAEYLEGKDQ